MGIRILSAIKAIDIVGAPTESRGTLHAIDQGIREGTTTALFSRRIASLFLSVSILLQSCSVSIIASVWLHDIALEASEVSRTTAKVDSLELSLFISASMELSKSVLLKIPE